MSSVTLENYTILKPTDLLVKKLDYYTDIAPSSIVVIDEETKQTPLGYFKIIKVGKGSREFSGCVGATIILPFGGHTPPFEVDGELYALVSEEDVVGVMEDD